MRAFANVNAKSVQDAVKLLQSKGAVPAGGGSDVLQLVKERIVSPDTLVRLHSIPGLDQVTEKGGAVHIGGQITLDALANHPLIKQRYNVLAEAAASVGTPQIRNMGTLAGNITQRPWCWYYRNGFPCYKNGGSTCFSVVGENDFHAIFGGGPSFIVHPSDTAVALAALEAKIHIAGPKGERTVDVAQFFTLPQANPSKENSLAPGEIVTEIVLPAMGKGTVKSSYHKELDREAWTHAVVSVAMVVEMDGTTCRKARIALGGVAPVPWRVPKAEALLVGQKITAELASKVADEALAGAKPLSKNAYKVPLARASVRRMAASFA